jgi:hypothetical protein
LAVNSGTDLGVTTGVNTTVTGDNYGIRAFNYGSRALTVTANGDVTGTNVLGIYAQNSAAGTDLDVTTGAGSSVTGGNFGILARNDGGGALTVTADGDVTGGGADGIYARHSGAGSIDVTVGSTSTVTSNGSGFAIRTLSGPSDVTVAGTLNGGAGGAVQFDQPNAFNDTFALETTAIINGNVFGGLGTDTLVLQGSGIGSFDAGQLVDFEARRPGPAPGL